MDLDPVRPVARQLEEVVEVDEAETLEFGKEIAERIGGPTVIKSQVLSGGRMKAGGVKFADTPQEAEAYAKDILQQEIGGHMPRGVAVDPKAGGEQADCAGAARAMRLIVP